MPTLTITAPRSIPLGEPVVAMVALAVGADEPAVRPVGHLRYAAGDLVVIVTGPDGIDRECRWPWPVDIGLAELVVGPGEQAQVEVPLVATADGGDPFPVRGAYLLVARLPLTRDDVIASPAVAVLRAAAEDAAAARSFEDRDHRLHVLGSWEFRD